jgi:uncharacterized protein YdaU (DUF1376 family)
MAKDRPLPLQWTQFSYDDFFRDEAVARMSNEEVGAYLRLLHAAWVASPPGHLPNDPEYLSAISGMGKEWYDHSLRILRAFKIHGDVLVQKRITEEYRAAERRREINVKRGVIGAGVRWSKHSPTIVEPWSGIADLDLDSNKILEESEGDRVVEQPHDGPNADFDAEPNGLVQPVLPAVPPSVNDVMKAVVGVADAMSKRSKGVMDKPLPKFSAKDVRDRIDPLPTREKTAAYRFAGWLYKGGITDYLLIFRFLNELVKRRIANPYAYFAPGGTARVGVEAKAEDREWLHKVMLFRKSTESPGEDE